MKFTNLMKEASSSATAAVAGEEDTFAIYNPDTGQFEIKRASECKQ